jgi:hypothetical protein
VRTAYERKEAICWVLRRGMLEGGGRDLMFTARFIGKMCGLPLWMVFYYTRQLIQDGVIEGRIRPDGSHVYFLRT